MANPTTNFGWVMPTSTSLVTNLPADFNTFGQGVDTSMAQLKGGTTGQILSKTSATDMAFTWVTPTDQTPLTTKGDLFTFSTVDARLAVGTNGYILSANSATATGLEWIAANPGDITGVTAGTGISGGGTSGDVTVTNSMATAMTTKGDLVPATGSGAFSRLGVGANDTVLTADSTAATGMKWATPSSGGMTLLSTTSLSGATTTISSISGSYTNLQVQIYNAAASSAGIVTFGINGDTTHHSQAALSGAGTIYATSLGKGNLTNNGNQDAASSGGTGNWTINFYNYAAGNRFHYEGGGMFYAGAWTSTFLGGAFESTAAMTSLTITTSAGTFSTGTVKIWGIK